MNINHHINKIKEKRFTRSFQELQEKNDVIPNKVGVENFA